MSLPVPVELRMRSKVHPDELEQKVGKIVTDDDYNVLLTGPAFVRKPDGRPLCVYLPGWLAEHAGDSETYDVLHSLRRLTTKNRGIAAGSRRVRISDVRTAALEVPSTIIGAMDSHANRRYCRLTSWTGKNLPKWETLRPVLRRMADAMEAYVPDRYQVQADAAAGCDPAWVVPGTPFTTVTVNNTYPTGVHTDKGDLATGFSTLACLRRGDYTGGVFVLPEYRVGIDMQDGDMLLLDAHEWHGNTRIEPRSDDAERISVVAYFREQMTKCGSPEDEHRRADEWHKPKRTPKTEEAPA